MPFSSSRKLIQPRQPQSLWVRFAAFLSFVAVLSALLAPISTLAQDVQSGKLGGLCSLGSPTSGNSLAGSTGNGDAAEAGSHCDLCGSPGLTLALLALRVIPTFAGTQVAAFCPVADVPAVIPGLPPGRGPPVV